MSAVINKVVPGSIAWELELSPGQRILSINGENFLDVLEYRFLIAEDYLELEIESPDGEITIYEIEKEEYEDLGIEFENPLIDKPKSCKNKCIFCFIDQLPKGLRAPLYFKDDDTRLSFLTGNYVTLTNMSDEELDKIIRLRLSPINISVHATDPQLRRFMLKNPNAGKILSRIKRLTDNGIQVNSQIVLVKNVNDGQNLIKTIGDLGTLAPMLHSISVVPVGLSRYREGLYPIEPFTKEDATKVVEIIEKEQQSFLKKFGSRIVYAADEFYIKSNLPLPSYDSFEDFPQIENGVGFLTSFLFEVRNSLKKQRLGKTTKKTLVTGLFAYPYIKALADEISSRYPRVTLQVVPVENKFFGEQITVTGLLCATDIYETIRHLSLGDGVILSRDTLRAEGDLFLDGMTKEALQEKLQAPLFFASNTGKDFIDKILE